VLVVVRVWLPDRPGALGQVASRIGAVRGDVLGIEILETGAGRVIDELVVQIDDRLIDLLVTEVDAVDGVSVEHVRPIEGDRLDPDLVALAVGAELAETDPGRRLEVLGHGVLKVADATWSMVIRDGVGVHTVGAAPEPRWVLAFLDGSQHLEGSLNGEQYSPSDLVWAHLLRSGVSIAAGRSDRPVHERERVRVALLARLADALID
jgi:hypothetical protein